MTRPEFSGQRSLVFSQWIRNNLPDSSTGLLVTNLDFILYNWKNKTVCLVEEKTHGGTLRAWQGNLFRALDGWLQKGVTLPWQYKGFHFICFENTSFMDGKCWVNGKEMTEIDVKTFLIKLVQ